MSLFDGIDTLLTAAFGQAVSVTPTGGTQITMKGVFSELPIDDGIADGRPGLAMMPVLQLPKASADLVAKGDQVTLTDGRSFVVLRKVPSNSQAADALQIVEMEQVTP